MAEEDPKPSFPPQHQDSIQPYDAGPFVPRAPRDDETFDASEQDIEGNDVPRAQDWLTWHGSPSKVQFAKALLAVLFSFEGWENATFLHSIHYDDFPEGHNRNYPPISSRSLARLKFYHGLDI
uniref:Uncharacterized protein n=1 Tax=Fusarium oxysporum (strain Fo5176) TaxID=660025 RepID=A0A0D2Y6U5_FUSOF